MDYIKKFISNEYDMKKMSYSDTVDIDVLPYDLIIIGASTWGDGKIPKNCKDFLIKNAIKYNKKWFVFGTGNTIFPDYCKAVDSIIKILEDTENEVIGSFKYEQRFNEDEYEMNSIKELIKRSTL